MADDKRSSRGRPGKLKSCMRKSNPPSWVLNEKRERIYIFMCKIFVCVCENVVISRADLAGYFFVGSEEKYKSHESAVC